MRRRMLGNPRGVLHGPRSRLGSLLQFASRTCEAKSRPLADAIISCMRFLLTHPVDTRPSLVVDTCSEIDERAIARLRNDLHGLGCANGLLFDPRQCIILHDTYSTMDASSIVVEGAALNADLVLARVTGSTIEERVERWLEALSVRWDSALPIEPGIAAPFIADVVPAASGSMLHVLKGAA